MLWLDAFPDTDALQVPDAFPDVFRGYRKGSVAWNELMNSEALKSGLKKLGLAFLLVIIYRATGTNGFI